MSAAAVQQFRLRWNNHQPNFISVFTTLLNSESLVDVTLGAEGKHVQAHKVVLSACSSYFQTLFTLNPCQHPIVILKDVKYDDLKVIVDFMYYGEVNVSQEQLPAILKTAEMLKVKGLAEMPEQNHISLSKSRSLSSDKGDDVATPPGDSASGWGSDSVRHSPSPQPMSPAMRRKRLRKTSSGSGSGSTERTSEELSVDINVVKAEPMSFQSEGESIRSSGSLRNSLQEASTESEPPDGTSIESLEDPNHMHSSQENTSGQNADSTPGTSTMYNPTADEEQIKFLGHSTESRSVREALNKRKKSVFTLRKGTTENFMQAIEEVREGRISFLAAGKKYGVSHMTLYRYYLSMGYPLVRKSNRTYHANSQEYDFLGDVTVSRPAESRRPPWNFSACTTGGPYSGNSGSNPNDQHWM
ncbi:protein tramtrack, beta isoform isoform X3 [Frankliniella occidentalis]|uniref:Protein tramtrack, beta isoform isoform X3 n=1 Tax=Frankliniella occidentalis TaxID=133901 RepID=A0A6J1TTF6_FRAOC|nr:protein tramtrack, beta isoform isoform X3 [Frankliniella occidentalis]